MWRLDPPRPDYVQAFYTAEVGDCRLAIASPTKMGRVHAAVTTADLIRRFSPRFVLLVGIAGGNRAEGVALGDIIVSDQIIDYELQRLQPGKPEIRQQAYAVHQRLLSEAQALLGWEAKIEVKRPGKGAVKRRVGPTLCGDKVIAIGSVLRTLGLQFPNVIAVEMEGAGCALACLRFDAGPGFLMIRGVSDLADEKKQTSAVVQWRPYASDAAAGFAMHLLHRILPRRNGRDR
jgi:nucleoside phosphorylase